MLAFDDYVAADATAWAQRVQAGEVTAAELAEAAIARAEAVNPSINAIATRTYAQARTRAQASPSGPFGGVPWIVKDLYQTMTGVPVTNGSRAFADVVGQEDAELVLRFNAAGLNTICTSTTPELGLAAVTESTLYGQTRNPWNLEHTPGGSSGGASALVAAGVAPAAHATDGGGSIRGPASCCGLFGLKPSRGRLPIAPGRTEGWFGCSVTHAVTRSVRDSARLLDATHGPEPGSRFVAPPPKGLFADAVGRPPGQLRIAYHCRTREGITPDPECVRAVEAAARLCESLGHVVEPAAPEVKLDDLGRAFGVSVLSSLLSTLKSRARVLGVDDVLDRVEETTRDYAKIAEAFTAVHLLMCNDVFMTTAIQMARFQETYDLILTPTMGLPPVPVGAGTLLQPAADFDRVTQAFSCFTAIYNATGQPAMTVPLHWSPEGLPIGVQFAGRLGEEELLFSVAGQLEQAQPWFDRRPPLAA